jgi:hypothetical protein
VLIPVPNIYQSFMSYERKTRNRIYRAKQKLMMWKIRGRNFSQQTAHHDKMERSQEKENIGTEIPNSLAAFQNWRIKVMQGWGEGSVVDHLMSIRWVQSPIFRKKIGIQLLKI